MIIVQSMYQSVFNRQPPQLELLRIVREERDSALVTCNLLFKKVGRWISAKVNHFRLIFKNKIIIFVCTCSTNAKFHYVLKLLYLFCRNTWWRDMFSIIDTIPCCQWIINGKFHATSYWPYALIESFKILIGEFIMK